MGAIGDTGGSGVGMMTSELLPEVGRSSMPGVPVVPKPPLELGLEPDMIGRLRFDLRRFEGSGVSDWSQDKGTSIMCVPQCEVDWED